MQQHRAENGGIETGKAARQIIEVGLIAFDFAAVEAMQVPERIADARDVSGKTLLRRAGIRPRDQIPKGVHRRFDAKDASAPALHVKRQETAGRPDFEHALTGEIDAAEILVSRLAQIPLRLRQLAAGQFDDVVEVAFRWIRDAPSNLPHPAIEASMLACRIGRSAQTKDAACKPQSPPPRETLSLLLCQMGLDQPTY